MMANPKVIDSLTVADLVKCPVWQYTNSDKAGETFVRPVQKNPTQRLDGKIVGTQIRLANGSTAWAIVGNVDVTNPILTQHFLTLSVERNGKWFALARYHDRDYTERGPEALARFLDLTIDDVFPLLFDIRTYAHGDPLALAGTIPREPQHKLSRADIIAMAVP